MFRVPVVAEIKELRGAFAVPVRSRLRLNLCKFQPGASARPAALQKTVLLFGVSSVSEQSSGR
jgi:hypothetical protein